MRDFLSAASRYSSSDSGNHRQATKNGHIRVLKEGSLDGYGAPSPTRTSKSGLQLVKEIKLGKQDPALVLRDRMAAGTLDLETVSICLGLLIYDRFAALSRSQRIARAGQLALGAPILAWLWKDDKRWTQCLTDNNTLFDGLCHLLIAEGQENVIVNLTKVDEPTQTSVHPA